MAGNSILPSVCLYFRQYKLWKCSKNIQQKRKLKPVLSRVLLGLKKLGCQILSVLFQNSILKYTAEYLFFRVSKWCKNKLNCLKFLFEWKTIFLKMWPYIFYNIFLFKNILRALIHVYFDKSLLGVCKNYFAFCDCIHYL